MKSFSDVVKILTMQLTNNFHSFQVIGVPHLTHRCIEKLFFVLLFCYWTRSLKGINGMNSDDKEAYEAYLTFPSPNKRPGNIQDLHMGQRNVMKYYMNRIILNAQRNLLTKTIF